MQDPVIKECMEAIVREGCTVEVNGFLVEHPDLKRLCDRLDVLGRQGQATPTPIAD